MCSLNRCGLCLPKGAFSAGTAALGHQVFKALKYEGLRVFLPHPSLAQAERSVFSAAWGSHNPGLGLALGLCVCHSWSYQETLGLSPLILSVVALSHHPFPTLWFRSPCCFQGLGCGTGQGGAQEEPGFSPQPTLPGSFLPLVPAGPQDFPAPLLACPSGMGGVPPGQGEAQRTQISRERVSTGAWGTDGTIEWLL